MPVLIAAVILCGDGAVGGIRSTYCLALPACGFKGTRVTGRAVGMAVVMWYPRHPPPPGPFNIVEKMASRTCFDSLCSTALGGIRSSRDHAQGL